MENKYAWEEEEEELTKYYTNKYIIRAVVQCYKSSKQLANYNERYVFCQQLSKSYLGNWSLT